MAKKYIRNAYKCTVANSDDDKVNKILQWQIKRYNKYLEKYTYNLYE